MRFHFIQNKTSCRHSANRMNRLNTVQCSMSIYRTLECESSFFAVFFFGFVCIQVCLVLKIDESIINVATIRLYRIHFAHFLLTKLFVSFGSWTYTLSLISIRYRLSIFKRRIHGDIETNLTAKLIKWLWCHSMSISIGITCHKWYKWFNRFYDNNNNNRTFQHVIRMFVLVK